MIKKIIFLISLFLFFIAIPVISHQAISQHFFNSQIFAQEDLNKQNSPPGFTIFPAFQEIIISNSQPVIKKTITVKNNTQQAESFEVFGVEFPRTQHFGSLTAIDFNQEGIKQQPNYLTFDAKQFVINPQEEREVEIKISDRADLRPGGTYTAIVIRAVAKKEELQQPVIPAFASLLLLRKIDGEIRNLSLTQIKESNTNFSLRLPTTIHLTFENNGNVHLIPRGNIVIKDILGTIIKQGTINEESLYILPDTRKEISVNLQNSHWLFPIMLITVSASGTAETINYSSEYSFLYISPFLIIPILLGGIALFIFLKKKKLKK